MSISYHLRALSVPVCCVLLAGSLQSQTARSHRQSRTAMLAELQLTPGQRAHEQAIHARFAPILKVAKRQSRDSAARVHAREMREVREMLTPSQQLKLDGALDSEQSLRGRRAGKVMPAKIALPH